MAYAVPSVRRRRLFRLLAAGLSASVAFVVAEAAMRLGGYSPRYFNPIHSFHVGDPILGYRGKPDFAGRLIKLPDFDAYVAHGPQGFRRHEHDRPVSEAAPRVYVLGDSFTWGYGVGQGDVYSDQLNKHLPGRRIMNFGLTGSGTIQQFLIFQEHVEERLKPGDTVVLAFFRNDFYDNMKGKRQAEVREGRVHLLPLDAPLGGKLKDWLKDRSFVFNLAAYCVDRAKHTARDKRAAHISPDRQRLADDDPRVSVAAHYLAALRDKCAAKEARFLVAHIPGERELGECPDRSPERLHMEQVYRRTFFDLAGKLNLETVDLLPALLAAKSLGEHERVTFPNDGHWNASGHAVVARTLAERIRAAWPRLQLADQQDSEIHHR